MNEAWIIDAARTPRAIGKVGKGALADIHPQHVLSTVLKFLAERNDLNTADIDDVIVGCSAQIGTQSSDIARMAALDAGFSINASGITVDRFCGSGISATNIGAASIMAGMEDLVVTGGVEMMSMCVPKVMAQPTDVWNLRLREQYPMTNVGIMADLIANEEGFSREALDRFGAESQRRAHVAITQGRFDRSLVPVYRQDGSLALDQEEYPRPSTTYETLAQMEPTFGMVMDLPFFDSGVTFRQLIEQHWPGVKIDHRHHAGTSSGVVDGAGALILASPQYAKANNLKPRARIRAMANMGHKPEYILNAPVDAARKVLSKAGMSTRDIDLFEINEAFAVVALKYMRDLNLDPSRVNINGGAIAMGHPVGATGAMLIGTALDELERQDKSLALITMCAAGGMAPAIIIERL
ncbi:acetyl-CoA C-acetyltransferase [Halioxenophilus aromaticivorans]|uniref:Acetyl-CoA C-acetyltransferase n=1 Tax=Halioxenophilus aromaticivorans TaxID=1306992 RepID=A0AAV3U6Y7_9ALTE